MTPIEKLVAILEKKRDEAQMSVQGDGLDAEWDVGYAEALDVAYNLALEVMEGVR